LNKKILLTKYLKIQNYQSIVEDGIF